MASEPDKTCGACVEKVEIIFQLNRRISQMSPHLLDHERRRAKAVWEAALFAHTKGKPGDPGPMGVIAAALKDAESRETKDEA